MTGTEIRAMILESGVRLWQVADALGIADTTFTKHLRHDFTDDETARIQSIIEELKAK